MADMRKSEDPGLGETIQRAWLTAKFAAGSKPLKFVDEASAGVRDWAIRGFRSFLSPEADSSFVSTARDITASPFKLFDWLADRPGDQRLSSRIEARIEKALADRSRPAEHGVYDIYMAAGWEPKGPIKINGKMVADPKPIDNMLAVFVRSPDGDVEILDPSIKVRSFSELKKLPKAMWSSPPNDVDRRWQETAGTFIEGQLAPLAISAGLGTAQKLVSGASKSTRIAGLMEKVQDPVGRAVKGLGAVAVLSNAGDITDLASGLASGYMTDKELKSLSRGLVDFLTSQRDMSDKELRKSLNGVLHEYSYKEGANFQQIYVPSLREKDNPWERLGSLLEGKIDAYRKDGAPWDDWKLRRINLGDVQGAIVEDRGFQKGVLGIAEKALSGRVVSDREILMLRIDLQSRYQKGQFHEDIGELSGKVGKGTVRYTSEEREETLKFMRLAVSQDVQMSAQDRPDKANRYGVRPDDKDNFDLQYNDQTLLKFVKDQKEQISKTEQRELNTALARAGAITFTPQM